MFTAANLWVLWIALAGSQMGAAFRSDYACQEARKQMIEAFAASNTAVLAAECLPPRFDDSTPLMPSGTRRGGPK